jgi:hypothetical protein
MIARAGETLFSRFTLTKMSYTEAICLFLKFPHDSCELMNRFHGLP